MLLSGSFLVKGGVALAHRLNISTLVVGVVVISFGTSAPELIISIEAALKGHPDISIGNVVGSNISNIALVLGITAIILPIPIKTGTIRFAWPVMMIAGILLYIFIFNDNVITFWEGIIFVFLLCAFIYWSLRKSKQDIPQLRKVGNSKEISLFRAIAFILFSSVGLLIGAECLVRGTVDIARNMGVSERVISVSFIAMGTSLPELATSVIAALKKETDISIGNIIGSNIFNIFAILGITAIVKDINITQIILDFDILWMLGISLLLFLFMMPVRRGIIRRWEGLVFVIIYALYIYFVFT